MPPSYTPKQIIKRLREAGFVFKRKKGSHEYYVRENGGERRGVVVPVHSKDCPTGTFFSILSQAGMTLDEFVGRG